MSANAVDQAAEDAKIAGSAAASSASTLSAEAQRSFQEAAKRFEKVVHEGVEQIRAQTRAYADTAGQQLEDAQRYMTERVRERPLTAAAAALGVGVLIGLVMAGGRRR
ncbi:MAG: glycine zipper domain-containing protein [Phenylobacterium sp.]|uniref:glycine zipper domain-containing protein n=1 Tax=Phenylobacterium sp. TaxID=1871053 RepID=UPI00391C8508